MLSNHTKTGLLALSLVCTTAPAATMPSGCYTADGKFTAAVKLPDTLNLNVSSPHMGRLGVKFQFTADQKFSLSLPLLAVLSQNIPTQLNGTWAGVESTGKFTVAAGLESLVQQFSQLGITATITSNSFAGKATSDGAAIKGRFNLGITVPLQSLGTASISLKGTYQGTRESSACSSTATAQAFTLPATDTETPVPTVTEFTEALLKRAIEYADKNPADALSQ